MIQTDFPEFDPSIAEQYGATEGFIGPDFLGIQLIDAASLIELVIRFMFNFFVCWVIIKFFYYKKDGRREFYFTFSLFSVAVFLLIYLLDTIRLQVGMVLGLFGIFGIMRYRTEQVSIREMTFLFVIITISVINGLSSALSITETLVANLMFIIAIAILENKKIVKHMSTKIILYEKINLIKPEKSDLLKKDLEKRTGIKIEKYEIGHVNFLRDTAFIKIYYYPENGEISTIGTITRLKDFRNA